MVNMLNISKRKYLSKYGNIENKGVVVDEKVNEEEHSYFSANRMVVTCTVRAIQNRFLFHMQQRKRWLCACYA